MIQQKSIEIDEFDYPLPDEKIAKFPLAQRHLSKLLIHKDHSLSEDVFLHLDQYLDKECLLFFNNTKVFQARLFFQKPSGSVIEIFCLEPANGADPVQVFQSTQSVEWTCLVGNNKRWKDEFLERRISYKNSEITFRAKRIKPLNETWQVEFSWDYPISFGELLDLIGEIPLPPYLNRKAEQKDKETYQTVYARQEGSVAAPTAGLHFTPEVFEKLTQKGIRTDFFTLHVGAGTFKPVSTKTIGEHIMHFEKIVFTKENIKNIYSYLEKKIIAVGTTSVRTLESLYWHGVKCIKGQAEIEHLLVEQWDPYIFDSSDLSSKAVFEYILREMEQKQLSFLSGSTQLMIAPGYSFRVVKGIVTNFHQPKSTLLLLVSAFIGDKWKEMYEYALSHDFRFLSYGDSCLLI
ncbi:S-adenosylmethionine:tRNA ribosyltransferase-isomerase [Bacteroidales bacterium OttesenSCG-928-C19]|nr:S-adenosylmethionine:tRNA ribosyltransferase-isomerase [Bacteroidales bacterium OttesenSCG-928-C19]